jgi:hypothetical protein
MKMCVGLKLKGSCDLIASSSTNHEPCHALLHGLKAGVRSDSIFEH